MVLGFALVLASLLVVSVEVVGALGLLIAPIALPGVASALALALLISTRVVPREPSPAGQPAASASTGTGPGPVHVVDRVASREARAIGLSAVVLLLTWLPLAWSRLALPPVSWDALTYHLAFPAGWLERGDLATTVPASGDAANTFYPLVGQMLLAWNLVSTGTDRWTVIAQLPFLLAGALAVSGIARHLGATRGPALLAGLLFAATPVALRQSVEVMLDVEQAALFAMAAYFALRSRSGSPGDAILGWLAVALLAGLKYSGAVLAVPLVLLLVVSGLRSGRSGVASLGVGLIAALAVGGFAYVRNAVTCGNPFMPLEVTVGGHVLWPGSSHAAAYFGPNAPRLGWRELLLSPRCVLEMGVVFLPALAILAIGALALRGSKERMWLAWIGVAAFALSALVLPFREHRYFLPVVAAACALAPGLLRGPRSRTWFARAVPVVVLLQAPVSLAYVAKDVMVLGPAGAAHAFGHGASTGYESSRYERWLSYWSTRHEWEDRAHARADLRDMAAAWAWIAGHTDLAPAIVAYAGANTPYPFTGEGSRNRVLFVPRSGAADGTTYRWGKPPASVQEPDSTAWRSNVRALGAAYLCVVRLDARYGGSGAFPIEDEWARADTDGFSPLWTSENARIYGVRVR
ncbi:MAG TPA: hypothetical protein VFR25_08220 [Candidatus Eisenbacteria bacterium]|nr:hypothetical protein [Candidatus Eisenbacteria bacterium]